MTGEAGERDVSLTKVSCETGKKRQLIWDWTKGTSKAKYPKIKNNQLSDDKAKKSEKHVCLECMELHLKGKIEKRFTTICRADKTSINRHKDRWHKLPNSKSCTIVPSSAPEVASLEDNYGKKKLLTNECTPTRHAESHSDSDPSRSEVRTLRDPEARMEESLEHTNAQNPGETLDGKLSNDSLSEIGETHLSTKAKSQATLLSFSKSKITEDTEKDASLKQVIDAVAELSLKVEGIGKQHNTLLHLAFEDREVRDSLQAMQNAKNIVELTESSEFLEWFYDEATECAVLRCLPCFRLHLAAKPTLASLTPLNAQRLMNSKTNGTLSTGIYIKKETTRLLINGHNQTWYRQKNFCIDHLCLIGRGSVTHKKAMEEYKKEVKANKRTTTTCGNIFRAAIVDLKLGAAGRHFETLISFLACCAVDVGSIGHSRNNFNHILYCLEKTVDSRINSWLKAPLPSTLIPPHFWVTVDKATPSRTTNQAVVIVGRDKSGVPCPIPVAAPAIYSGFTQATYDDLARQLLQAISKHFSEEVLSRLCGVAADGPYQATGFAEQLRETLAIEDEHEELAMPVTWDTAHVLNLAVTDVRDSKTESGNHFRRFVKRCNVFNHVLSNGKGFAFLQMVDEDARRPVSYATQRFASSSYDQWMKIEKSYNSFWRAFELLHPRRSEEEEWQYMIAGSDFVADLLAFLDIMDPVVDLMSRAQALDTPVWKLKLWWPSVKAKLMKAGRGEPEAFPRLQKAKCMLKPGGTFKGITLLEGWLVEKHEDTDAGERRFCWKMREEQDIKEDHERLARDLMVALDKRISSVINERVISKLEVFDAAQIVKLQCGSKVEDSIKFALPEGELEEYGVEECKHVLMVALKMSHIQSAGMNFDPRMAHTYMAHIKEAVMQGVWRGICPEWFDVVNDEGNVVSDMDSADLIEFCVAESTGLDSFFTMAFSDGKLQRVRLHEERVYQSFYSNKEVYNIAKPPSCALLDIVLAKGGPEAIAESFYNSMRNQQQSGGQSNETLARRTKVNWCLPSLKHCDEIIKEGVTLYLRGDDVIRPHKHNHFFSDRAKEYFVSKVVDRLHAETGRCPFLADN